MSKATDVVTFIVKVFVTLTARLAVELLKLGLLTLIIFGAVSLLVLVFIIGLQWTYVTYDGDILAMAGVVVFLATLEVTTYFAIQYVVRDFLNLTDMSLWTLSGLVLKAVWRSFWHTEADVGRSKSSNPKSTNSSSNTQKDRQE